MSVQIKRCIIFIIGVILAFQAFTARAADWSDLDEGEHRVFGSEKEQKYSINAFFIEREKWEDHSSFMLLWLYKYTDYPRYTSLRVLPFWYRLSSKIDNRQRSFVPFLLWYNRVQGDGRLTVNPVYYSSYDKTGSDRSFLWLLWWGGRDEENFKSSYLFLPVFYKNSHSRSDGTSRGSIWVNPLFFATKNVNSFGDIRMSHTRNFSLLHYYSSETESPPMTGERAWWVPIIPLVYRSASPRGGHQNIFWLVDYSWWTSEGKDRMKRFWAAPFWFWKGGSDGYSHILPPLIVNSRSSNGESYSHFLPLYKASRSISSEYVYTERKYKTAYEKDLVTALYCSFQSRTGEKKWEGDIQSSSFWFPVIPLYYSGFDANEGTHRSLLWVFSWHRDTAGATDRFWFIPFYFSGKDSYRHVLPPLYISWRDQDSGTVISPLWYYHREKTAPGGAVTERSSRLWIPIIPVIFTSSSSPEGSHKNVLMLWDWSRNASGGMERFWFSPFYFQKRDSYLHVLPPLYLSWKDAGEKSVLTPLWYYHTEKDGGDAGTDGARFSRLWVPFVPFLYTSSNTPAEGSHKNYVMLFDVTRDASDNLKHLWFIPLVFHESGEGGYRYYFPFYFRPSGWTEERGLSFGPLHYKRWSPEHNVRWSYLVHYYNSTPAERQETTIWAPLYFSWQRKKTDFTLFLPLYFDYRDSRNRLYVNILGISKSIASGPNPNVSLGLGRQETGYYVDTDISWLYDAVSIATRVTLKKPWKGTNNDSGDAAPDKPAQNENPEENPGTVSLSEKKGFGRENSQYFAGFKLLFGLCAIERADSKRHFRLLPLSWITWDEASEDRMKWVVNYLSYKSEDFEYWVFFPIVGKQREGKSHREGYLLNLYWNEYYEKEDLTERTLLWPLANWYHSPAKSGWRVIPLVRHWETSADGVRSAGTITPVFYTSSKKRIDGDKVLRRFSISPLHFYRKKADESGETGTRFFPLIPLYFHTSQTVLRRDANALLPMKDAAANPSEGESGYSMTDSQSFLFPVYYRSSESRTDLSSGRGERSSSLVGLPFLYYSTRTALNGPVEGAPPGETLIERRFFLLGYYGYSSPAENSSSILFGLYRHTSDPQAKSSKLELFYGLLTFTGKGEVSESWFFPLYYYGNSPAEHEFSLLLGLYKNIDYPAEKNSEFSLLYGLYFTSVGHEPRTAYEGGKEFTYSDRVRTWFLLPLYYYQERESEDPELRRAEWTHYTWLWYKHYAARGEESYSSTMWFPIVPLVYYKATASRTHVNVLGLFDTMSDSARGEGRLRIFPLFYHGATAERDRYSFLLGLYTHSAYPRYHKTVNTFLYWIAGTTHRSFKSRAFIGDKSVEYDAGERTWWLAPIYYYQGTGSESGDVPGRESMHLSLFWYKSHYAFDEHSYESTFWCPIIPLTYFNATRTYTHLNVLGLIDYMSDEARHENRFWLLPLFYNRTSPRERTHFILGLYLHSSPEYERQNLLYLYDHRSWPQRQRESHGYVLGLIDYDISPEIKQFRLAYGLLAGYRSYRQSADYEFDVLAFMYAQSQLRGTYRNYLTPLWYYKSTEDGYSLLIPPLLTYMDNEGEEGKFQMAALGALWYRNYKPKENSDRQMLLLGIPYYKVRRPERGYESVGSLWGILWESETESETNFSKFSLLKFVYKRVDMNGDVYHRVMGIRF